MKPMDDELLSRKAVDRELRRIALKRAPGKKLVGIRFDNGSKTWFVVLKNGAQTAVASRQVEAHAPSQGRPKPHSRRLRHIAEKG